LSFWSCHPVSAVHGDENLDKINKMNRMAESDNRSLSSDHPANPVHPVQPLASARRALKVLFAPSRHWTRFMTYAAEPAWGNTVDLDFSGAE
jgi:hypothetical protein